MSLHKLDYFAIIPEKAHILILHRSTKARVLKKQDFVSIKINFLSKEKLQALQKTLDLFKISVGMYWAVDLHFNRNSSGESY